MSSPTWVLDTNVVVSGLLSAHGHPARLLDAVLDGRLRLAFDDRIEAEYREVLSRPRFSIPPERREAFLASLSLQEYVAARLLYGNPSSALNLCRPKRRGAAPHFVATQERQN